MTTSDKELLELAAKAAGYSMSPYWDDGTKYDVTEGPHGWNPLTDDGDALRLAVKLGLSVWPHPKLGMEYCASKDVNNVYVNACEHTGNDPYVATRRAIVRAAAAIGEKL